MANKNQSLRFKLGLAKWRIWTEDAIQSLIDSTEKTDKDVEQIQSDIEKIEISTSVFEKGLAKDATYDWGADLVINSKDDVYYISLNPEIATVNQNGVVKMLVDFDITPVFAEILAIGKTCREALLVTNEDHGVFKFEKRTDDDFKAVFDTDAWLVKPSGSSTKLTSDVDEPCDKGICYLIYSLSNTGISISSNNIIGEVKTNHEGAINVSFNKITLLLTPNSTNIDAKANSLDSEAIEMLLQILVDSEEESGYLDISEGENASLETWSSKAINLKDTLVLNSWGITYNSSMEL